MPSFDVVSIVDPQEIDNALNQTRKEIASATFQRHEDGDPRRENAIHITSDDDFKVKAVVDVLQSKLVRRRHQPQALGLRQDRAAAGGLAKQTITVQQGIDTDKARAIVKLVKDSKIKVQSQIQADQVTHQRQEARRLTSRHPAAEGAGLRAAAAVHQLPGLSGEILSACASP